MKNLSLLLLTIVVISCSKNNTNPDDKHTTDLTTLTKQRLRGLGNDSITGIKWTTNDYKYKNTGSGVVVNFQFLNNGKVTVENTTLDSNRYNVVNDSVFVFVGFHPVYYLWRHETLSYRLKMINDSTMTGKFINCYDEYGSGGVFLYSGCYSETSTTVNLLR